ncbi:MAG TPA: ABC transporter ATP-binding protein [Verrucomicrobiales bacterium]|nr:ABC transporter ATP-binding protein [Verrucomicrobiales bacterium]
MIRVEKVSKYFGDLRAVDDLSLEIEKNQFVALLGPNGAGKTTLIEMIEGIQKPTSGTISIKGMNWNRHRDALYRILGVSLQETQFMDKITVEEIMRLFSSFYGLASSRTEEVLEMVDLESKRKTYTVNLSGGQRQRLALGVALIHNPEILLLDEPTTGLDPHARREVWKILLELKSTGTTLILTTHYMEEAQALCERILIMFDGRIQTQGTLREILNRHGCWELIEFRTEKPCRSEWFDTLPGFLTIESNLTKEGNIHRTRIQLKDIAAAMPSFWKIVTERNLRIEDMECRKMNLDDLFVSLTGRHLEASDENEDG